MPFSAVDSDVEVHDLSKIAARAKCTTVTMMLAERIIRNDDWSVDGEQLVGNNPMNLWQTLEFLSGANSRKRYHYEGYNDTENAVRTLIPSWRRDSFVEKKDVEVGVTPRTAITTTTTANTTTTATTLKLPDFTTTKLYEVPKIKNDIPGVLKQNSAKTLLPIKRTNMGKKKKSVQVEIDPVYAMSPLQYTDIVKCK